MVFRAADVLGALALTGAKSGCPRTPVRGDSLQPFSRRGAPAPRAPAPASRWRLCGPCAPSPLAPCAAVLGRSRLCAPLSPETFVGAAGLEPTTSAGSVKHRHVQASLRFISEPLRGALRKESLVRKVGNPSP
jgi:hypothetical protein